MADTIEGLSQEIARLKDDLLKGTITIKYKVPDKTDPDKTVDKTAEISQLKNSLIEVSPKILTQESAAPFIKKIEDIHEEAVKAPLTEWLEAAGLDGIAAGVEKIAEGKSLGTWWPYFAAAFVGLAIPAIGLLLAAKFTDWSRALQAKIFSGQAYARNEQGTWSRQDVQAVNDREARVFNGGGIGTLPSEDSLRGIREELQKLIDKITVFNRKAPSFRNKFNKLPSARALAKTATAVEKVGKAVDGVNLETLSSVTTKTEALKDVMSNFAPNKIPNDLRAATRAAEGLDRAGQNLQERFQALKLAAAGAERAIAGT
ncbi:hypothetical protein [Streptomyces sp. NPDC096030]|uniref:hypothetical protein n=1 Tax=Streptomyces sp. NPDC096030 TaxID=3155423 RepID=UPI0033337DC0